MEGGNFAELRVSKHEYSIEGGEWQFPRYEVAPFLKGEKLISEHLRILHNLSSTEECIDKLRALGYYGIGTSVVHSDKNYNTGKKLGFHRIHNGNLMHVVRASEDELKEIFEGIKDE